MSARATKGRSPRARASGRTASHRTGRSAPSKRSSVAAAAGAPTKGGLQIVGIGASAGGLEALRALFGAIRTKPPLAFVVVQHLAPLHRSRLVELIAHATRLPVEEVPDGAVARAGVIYITPPNKDVLLENGVLRLREPHLQPGPKPSIDLFFESLARELKDAAVGIVLSGTGSDGAAGIRAIKAEGGITFCQTVESAKYDGMPKAARLTGSVDFELSPEDIARELDRFDRRALRRRKVAAPGGSRSDPYDRILAYLERESGAGFSGYKQNTVRRRIERRMVATRSASLEDYARHLEKHPDEVRALFQDILISVTSFFRDPEAFGVVERLLEERIRAKEAAAPLRCWIVGCATGEEAFSIGILVCEALEKLKKELPVQIYATDLDEQALATARKGVYAMDACAPLSQALREKYFHVRDDTLQVRNTLRDKVVFARHDVVGDPPFLNIDLACCRNVLIYFQSRLQEQVFRTVHYALQPGGLLFLGRSEAVPATNPLFELVDKHARLYRRTAVGGEMPRTFNRPDGRRVAVAADAPRGQAQAADDAFHALVTGIAPDSILVDEALHVRHVYGRAGAYLAHPAGEATQNITKLLAPDMGLELGTLIHRCQRVNAPAQGRRHEYRVPGQTALVQLKVVPLPVSGRRHYLVVFDTSVEKAPKKRAAPAGPPNEQRMRRLEQELATTREHLQTVIEEQETSNEELQALNEELQSANEELQSSNEELETTNEELQSANEELTTVNEELNVKSGELQTLNQRLAAIQAAIVYPLLIIDCDCRLLAFNPAARHLLRTTDADLGLALGALRPYIDLQPVVRAAEEALSSETEPCLQFGARERSFEVQIHLFRGARDAVEGAVVSFVENTEIVAALEESRLNRGRLSSILEGTPAIVTMKDLSGVYTYANRRFFDVTGRAPDGVIGRTDEEIFGREVAAAVQERDYEVMRKKRSFEFSEPFEFDGRPCIWRSSKFPLFDQKGRVHAVCSVSLDMTQRIGYERQLELFKRAVSASNNGIVLLEESGKDLVVAHASDRVPETIGVPERELHGLTLGGLFERMNIKMRPPQLEALVAQIREEGEGHFTLNLERGGKDAWVDVRSAYAELAGEARRSLILNFFDVSARVEDQRTIATQQEELTKFSRYSALAQIASGIAHEINTPLNVITTKTDYIRMLAKKERLEGAAALKLATDIDQMVRNVSSIVYGLRSVALRDPAKFEIARFKRIVLDTVKICEFRLQRYGIDLKLDLPQKDLAIRCYPVQITQILINLINNSVDAIQERTDRWISIGLRRKGNVALLTVTDSGEGIDPAIAEKVMTPFFTTKKDQKGTGIGLSLSRSIARRHGGDLVLDAASTNTTFRLELPI